LQAICIFGKFAKNSKNMNKKVNFGISKFFISLIVLSTLMSSCVQGDYYELYDDNLSINTIPLKKISKDDYSGSQTIGGQPNSPFTNTCFIVVAAYYKNGKNENNNYMNCYYDIFDNMIRGFYGGHLPGWYNRADEATKWFVERGVTVSNVDFPSYLSQHANKSVTFIYSINNEYFNNSTLRDYIESHKTTYGLDNNDYIIEGYTHDGEPHFAVYSGFSINDDTVQINTFDPGCQSNSGISQAKGVYIPAS